MTEHYIHKRPSSITPSKWMCGVFFLLLLAACSKHPSLPSSFTQVNEQPRIYPDYVGVTIPPNIAPLNFLVDSVDDIIGEFKFQDSKLTFGGKANKVQIDEREWKELLASARGNSLSVTVYAKKQGKKMVNLADEN